VVVDGVTQTYPDWDHLEWIEIVAGAQNIVFGTGDRALRVCVAMEDTDACRPVGQFQWQPGTFVDVDLVQNTTQVDVRSGTGGTDRGIMGTPFRVLLARAAAGMNRFREEALDGYCDGAVGPCDVTTNQLGFDVAIEGRIPVSDKVTAGVSLGWTDLDGAEIMVGEGAGAFEGHFRATAVYGQGSFYFDVLEAYPQVRPYALLGLAHWSAESGSSQGSQSYSQDDSGTGLMYGAGVTYSGLGPGEVGLTFRRLNLSSEEHSGSPVDNAVTQLSLSYSFRLKK
jgi:hypothetical protein